MFFKETHSTVYDEKDGRMSLKEKNISHMGIATLVEWLLDS